MYQKHSLKLGWVVAVVSSVTVLLAVAELKSPSFKIALAQPPVCPTGTFPNAEALDSTLKLQMPFLSGEDWVVGGGGSFYGNYYHCNSYNDHYATDWNRPDNIDSGKAVLAVADGTATVDTTCLTALGCYVELTHGDGYKTIYAHLSQVLVVNQQKVKVGQLIGRVGATGTTNVHLHLSFLRNGSSKCWNNGGPCSPGETPQQPQGHKPSPMMTESGPVNLVDGTTYTSINGRVFLPNIRHIDGWATTVTVKNNTTNTANVKFVFRGVSGSNICGGTYPVVAQQRIVLNVSCPNPMAVGYIDSDQDISVSVTNQKPSPVVRGAHTGISASVVWRPFNIPLVLKRKATASGMGDSDILIQNATTVATNFQVDLIALPGSGYSNYTKSFFLPAHGGVRYILKNDSSVPDGWIGSAVVKSGTFAVVSDSFAWDGQTDFAFAGYPPESKTSDWFIPLFLVRRSTATGIASTPINVQNVTGSGISVNAGEMSLNCKADAGSGYNDFTVSNPSAVADNASYAFNPVVDTTLFPIDGWTGSCRLTTPSSKKVLVLAQIRYPANFNASAYEAIRTGTTDKQVFFPVIQKLLMDGSATSVVIQNLSTISTASVTFYYKASCYGFNDVTVGPYTIPVGGSINHNHRLSGSGSGTGQHNLPDGWCGSLKVVSSNQPIDGFGQITNVTTYSGDTIMAYNAITRP